MPPARRQLLMPQLPPGVSMALPVVQIPGCVAAHVDSDLQTELTTSDPSQVRIFCDAGMPMFDAMDYQPFLSLPVTKPEIPKFANNSAAPESSTSAANSRKTDTGSQQSGEDQLPSSKPQCKEGEILRKGNASRSRSLSPRNSRLVASTCHRLSRSQPPQQSQRPLRYQHCSPGQSQIGC